MFKINNKNTTITSMTVIPILLKPIKLFLTSIDWSLCDGNNLWANRNMWQLQQIFQ